jgi:predicted aldo/keto reductase-like oxidoreductase
LRFVLANPDVHVALSGMGTPEMVEENVAAAEAGPLDEAERESLSRLVEETKKLAELYCTGCAYCMPCEHGVDIPGRFSAMNYFKVYGMETHAKETYARLRGREKKKPGGGECVECRECEEKCPQKIPIVEQLKATEEALGD